jgi:hypothetical protein
MPRARPSAQATLYAEGKAVGVWPGSGSLADATCPATPRARPSAYGLVPLNLTPPVTSYVEGQYAEGLYGRRHRAYTPTAAATLRVKTPLPREVYAEEVR